MVVSTRGDSAAASTDAVGAPSRMDCALNRVRDVLEPVGETLAVVTCVFGIVAGVVEIIRDVRYIVNSARDALDHGDGGGLPSKSGGAVDLAGYASASAGLERKLIHAGERDHIMATAN
uniref:Uncharacterized protein n=1 Tax=Avena sativa TaxID=4498 RepID=A0ACD5XYH4_AVESA